jgi:hypothetical protein
MFKDKISSAERKRIRNFAEQSVEQVELPRKTPNIQYQPVPIPELKNDLPPKKKKRLDALAIETEKQKKAIVLQLHKTPIVQIACERSSVGRSTYYKWRARDKIFARVADRALESGRFFINDLAKSKLLQQIKDGILTAIIFWLKHNDPQFAPVNRIIHEYEVVTDRLSVEEENIAMQEMSKMMAIKSTPKFTAKETEDQIENDLRETELNTESIERIKSFEEDFEDK